MRSKPVASASPSAWLLIPAFRSCSTQTSGENARATERCTGLASEDDDDDIALVYETAVAGTSDLLPKRSPYRHDGAWVSRAYA